MTPKTTQSVNNESLPLALKFNDKEYIIKSTSKGSLHMSKNTDDKPITKIDDIKISSTTT